MKTATEVRTELAVKKADMTAMGILFGCINTALILVGIAFALIKFTGNGRVDAYSIVLFSLAGVIALVGFAAMVMYRNSVRTAIDETDEHY